MQGKFSTGSNLPSFNNSLSTSSSFKNSQSISSPFNDSISKPSSSNYFRSISSSDYSQTTPEYEGLLDPIDIKVEKEVIEDPLILTTFIKSEPLSEEINEPQEIQKKPIVKILTPKNFPTIKRVQRTFDSVNKSQAKKVVNIKKIPASQFKPQLKPQPSISESEINQEISPPTFTSNSVKCLDCNQIMGLEELLNHREVHHPKPKTERRFFPTTQIQPQKPQRLERSQIDDNLIVVCEFCFSELKEKNLEAHISRYHGEKKFLCHICSLGFVKELDLKYHLLNHNPDRKYQCDLCDKKYHFKADIREHMATHVSFTSRLKNYKMECEFCEQKFKVKSRLLRHLRKCHKNGLVCGAKVNSETNYFDCFKCGGSYSNLINYRRHKCENGKVQIKCLECQRPARSREMLEAHMMKCSKRKSFGC